MGAEKTPDPTPAGTVLDGRYLLEERLGRGGMGSVYRAIHRGTGRTVAVKLIAPGLVAGPEFLERFQREARAAGRLRHPNVVDVTDFGVEEPTGRRRAYLVMEYLDGCTLADVLAEEKRLPLRWTLEVLEQTCSAVDEAHRHGILHRDLKPENLWLEPDRRGGYRVKVLDFGLAKLAEGAWPPPAERVERPRAEAPLPTLTVAGPGALPSLEEAETWVARRSAAPADEGPAGAAAVPPSESQAPEYLTSAGDVLGTPHYMSPEQCRGAALDERSDVYSLGVVAYRMLSGRLPFEGDVETLLRKHQEQPPPPLASRPEGVPAAVEEVVLSALAKDPAARPHSAGAFAGALRAASEGGASLVQRTLSMFSEHPGPFLRIAALAHVPFLAVALAAVLLGTAEAAERMGPSLAQGAAVLLVWAGALGLAAAVFANSAVCEPLVVQLLVAPQRSPSVAEVLRGVRGRLVPYLRTLAPYLLGILALAVGATLTTALSALQAPLAGTALARYAGAGVMVAAFAWLGAVSESYFFAAQVVVMEGVEGEAALARSRELVRRMRERRRPRRSVGLLTLLALFAAGVVVGRLTGAVSSSLGLRLDLPGLSLLQGLALLAAPLALAGILGAPFISIGFALLYFRTRQASGETLREALDRLRQAVLPEGHWQRRSRDHIRDSLRREF